MVGSAGIDWLIGGAGSDTMDGMVGGDEYHVAFAAGDMDVIADSGATAQLRHALALQASGGEDGDERRVLHPGASIPDDTIVFGAGVAADQLRWRVTANVARPDVLPQPRFPGYSQQFALDIRHDNGGVVRTLFSRDNFRPGEINAGVERFRFADGTEWSMAEFMANVTEESNHAPQPGTTRSRIVSNPSSWASSQ